MIELKRIYPECYADTLLVELLLERGKPGHCKGISKVAKALERIKDNALLFGIVDSDRFKNHPPYFKNFTITKEDKQADEGLILKQIPDSKKYLIFVCPEFEPWIWKRAKESGINPSDYTFDSLDNLYQASKRMSVSEDVNLKGFVNSVVRSDNAAIATLRNWLKVVLPDHVKN
jgi:hypothetical protein